MVRARTPAAPARRARQVAFGALGVATVGGLGYWWWSRQALAAPTVSLEEILRRIAGISESAEQVAEAIRQADQNLQDAQANLDQAAGAAQDVAQALGELPEQASRYEDLRAAMEAHTTRIGSSLDDLRSLREQLVARLGEDAPEVQQLDSIIETVNGEVAALEADLLAAQQTGRITARLVQQARERITELEARLSAARDAMTELQQRVAEALAATGRLLSEVEALERDVEKLQVVLGWLVYEREAEAKEPAVSSAMQGTGLPGVLYVPPQPQVLSFKKDARYRDNQRYDESFEYSLGKTFAAEPVSLPVHIRGAESWDKELLGFQCDAVYKCCGGPCESCHQDTFGVDIRLEALIGSAAAATSPIKSGSLNPAYHNADWQKRWAQVELPQDAEIKLPGGAEYELKLRQRAKGWIRKGWIWVDALTIELVTYPLSGLRKIGAGLADYQVAASGALSLLDFVQSRSRDAALATESRRLVLPSFTGFQVALFVLPFDQRVTVSWKGSGAANFNAWPLSGLLLFANRAGRWDLVAAEHEHNRMSGYDWSGSQQLDLPSGVYAVAVWAGQCSGELNCPSAKATIEVAVDYESYTL